MNALRGIAAILVAVLHFHFFLGPVAFNDIVSLIDKFYLMVDMFFILSGFIMCYVYESTFNQVIFKINYKEFLISRLARIYPLHVFTLCAELLIFITIICFNKFDVLPPTHQHLYRLDAIPIQLTFLQTVGIYNFDTWNAPAWSLSAEWWAYILFPFLFVIFKKLGYKKWIVGFIVAILGWFAIEFCLSSLEPFMQHPLKPNKRTLDVNWYFGTLRGIIGFIADMSVWQLFVKSKFKNTLGDGWALFVLAILIICSMYFGWYDTFTVFLFTIFILSSAYGSFSIDIFYSWKVFEKLGKWSFSIYIWHMIIIHLIKLYFLLKSTSIETFRVHKLLKPIKEAYPIELLLLGFLLVTCFVGWLSFRFIEIPTRQWINNKYGKKQQSL